MKRCMEKEDLKKRIANAKIREAEEDKWVKDNNITLKRDSCEKCIEKKEKDSRNSLGKRMFCSAVHAYEVIETKKNLVFRDLRKNIFDTIYEWGQTGVVADENAPAIKKLLSELEERWY